MGWRQYEYTPRTTRATGLMNYSHRPMIDVEVSKGRQKETIKALVDSGTEVTIMDLEIAEILGIDLEKCERVDVFAFTTKKEAYIESVGIRVPDFKRIITTKVLFAEDTQFDIILGQVDFFQNFDVRFEKAKNKFFLREA